MNNTNEAADEPFVTLKDGPMDGIIIPRREKDRIVDDLYVGPGPYYPSYRIKTGSVPLIAEFEGYQR